MSGEPVKGDQLLLQPLNVLPGYLQSGRIEPWRRWRLLGGNEKENQSWVCCLFSFPSQDRLIPLHNCLHTALTWSFQKDDNIPVSVELQVAHVEATFLQCWEADLRLAFSHAAGWVGVPPPPTCRYVECTQPFLRVRMWEELHMTALMHIIWLQKGIFNW